VAPPPAGVVTPLRADRVELPRQPARLRADVADRADLGLADQADPAQRVGVAGAAAAVAAAAANPPSSTSVAPPDGP